MTEARIIGLDYGEVRVGVAVSDGIGLTAQPVAVLDTGPGFDDALLDLVATLLTRGDRGRSADVA